MRELIESFESLLVSTVMHGGDAVEGSQFILDTVDWKRKPKPPTPATCKIVDDRLEEACRDTGGYGSTAAGICDAVMAAADQLHWVSPSGIYLDQPESEALSQVFAYTTVIGGGCPLEAEGVYMGLSLQGPDILYPSHAHQAEELYWIVGGNGDWKTGIDPWHPVEPGEIIVHPTGIRHAMQTNQAPLLTVWAWWRHIDSPIIFVRG